MAKKSDEYPIIFKDFTINEYEVINIKNTYGVLTLDVNKGEENIYNLEIRYDDLSDDDYYSVLLYHKKLIMYNARLKKDIIFNNFPLFLDGIMNRLSKITNEMIENNKQPRTRLQG
jgi:hypothetical protein